MMLRLPTLSVYGMDIFQACSQENDSLSTDMGEGDDCIREYAVRVPKVWTWPYIMNPSVRSSIRPII